MRDRKKIERYQKSEWKISGSRIKENNTLVSRLTLLEKNFDSKLVKKCFIILFKRKIII